MPDPAPPDLRQLGHQLEGIADQLSHQVTQAVEASGNCAVQAVDHNIMALQMVDSLTDVIYQLAEAVQALDCPTTPRQQPPTDGTPPPPAPPSGRPRPKRPAPPVH